MRVDHLMQTRCSYDRPVSRLLAAACGMSAAKVESLAVGEPNPWFTIGLTRDYCPVLLEDFELDELTRRSAD